MDKLRKFLDNLLEKKISPIVWLANFLGVIAIRIFLDKFVAKANTPLFDLVMDIHNILFFFLTFLIIWVILSLIFGRKPFELAYFMALISFSIIFPPIFDLIATKGQVYWSFYLISAPQDLFQQFLTIFGHLPSGIVYFGSKIVFISGILLVSGLVFVKTKSAIKTILAALGIYSSLFFMAAFPSLLAYIGLNFEKGRILSDIQPFEIIQFFSKSQVFGIKLRDIDYSLAYNLNFVYFLLIIALLAIMFFWSEKKKFISILKNIRYPQIVSHLGLLIFGMGLGNLAFPGKFSLTFFPILALVCLMISVWFSWETSVVINDLYDTEIDKITNKSRPLPSGNLEREEFKNLGVVFFVLALIGGFMLDYKFGIILLIYQVLSWFYSAEPFRLKRFLGAASILASSALILNLFMGFILISGEKDIAGLSSRVVFYIMLGNLLCMPIKDFKDIEGDKKDNVYTLPVLVGEEKGRLIVAIGFFVSYMVSVFFLNEMRLFWWALLFGGISFLVITSKKINPYNLLWWNLGIAFFYLLFMIKIIFLK